MSLDGFSCRFNTLENKISEPNDRVIKFKKKVQSEKESRPMA